MLRSCYRSFWRLHEDKSILTPGRFYFCDDDTPSAPFPTLLGSRNWDRDDYPAARVREWGEWDGKQPYDRGAKPARVPAPRRVGSLDCIANGATAGDVAPGNPSQGPFRTVCIGGVVYSFPSNITVGFNVAYQNRDFTYYGDVSLSMVEADCEARWEGIGGPPNTKAIVRVTEGPGGTLITKFYLCELPTVFPCEYCVGTDVPFWKVTLADFVPVAEHPELEILNDEWILPNWQPCGWKTTVGGITVALVKYEPGSSFLEIIVDGEFGPVVIASYSKVGGGAFCSDPYIADRLAFNNLWLDDAPLTVPHDPIP